MTIGTVRDSEDMGQGVGDGSPPSACRTSESRTMPDWVDVPKAEAVIRAGDLLRVAIPADRVASAYEAFGVGHQWRAAHVPPMHSMRLGLGAISRAICPEAIVAGRIKSMVSIRRKLRRTRLPLWEMQDVAGIRAIVSTQDQVEGVARRYMDGATRHRIAGQDDYISSPKVSGYRSRHLIMRFAGEGDTAAYSKRSVEIQIRTALQHSWATALEAVGLMRGEDLKAGEGDEEWLRLFRLMSAQFADDEGLPVVPGQPADRNERLKQIRILESYLGALAVLDGYKHAIKRVKSGALGTGGRFIVTFDRDRREVSVASMSSIEAFIRNGRSSDVGKSHSVVVEVDNVDALAAAYPNYFADVTLFASKLRLYLTGRDGTRRHPLAWLADYQWRKF